MIRGDRDRQDTFLATVVHADLSVKGIDQPCIPLVDEGNSWDNDQRGSIHLADSMNSHKGLACSGGQNNAPALPGLLPSVKGGDLVIMRFSRFVQGQPQALPTRDMIVNTSLPQPGKNRAIMIRFTPPSSLDPPKGGRKRFLFICPKDNECTPLKDNRLVHKEVKRYVSIFIVEYSFCRTRKRSPQKLNELTFPI